MSEIFLVSLVALIPLLAGFGLVSWLIPTERRLPVLIGGGLAVGQGLSIFILMSMLHLLPMNFAVILVFVVCAPPAVFAITTLRRRSFIWGVSFGWSVLALSLLALISIGAAVDLTASVWNGSTHENLVVRMAMAAHAAESTWPVMDPYSPDHQRLYRHAAQVWTSVLMRASGTDVYIATLVTVLTSVWGIAGGLFAAIARIRSYLAGLLGAAFSLTATPANFLAIWKTPFGSLSTSNAYGIATVKRELAQGYVLGHGLILVPGNDFTILFGLSAGAGTVFLISALSESQARHRTCVFLAAISLAAAGASAEQLFPVLATTLLIMAVSLAFQKRWKPAISFTGIVGISAILVIIPEGTYSALIFGSEVGQRASFAFTPEYILRLPTEYLMFAGSESRFFTAPSESFRVWLFEPIVLKEIGWIYLALLTLVALGRSRKSNSLLPFAIAPAIALLIPGVVSDQLYEINIAKFTVLGISLGGLGSGIAAAELLRHGESRVLATTTKMLAAGLVIFASATWFLTVPVWPAKLSEQPYPHLTEDLEAAQFLRSLDYGRRALILPGPTNKEDVNSDGWEGMHRFVVSFGATSIPMGLDRWGADHLYQPFYLPAYNSLDKSAMAQLGIDTIYVAPHLLTEPQRIMLEDAIATGRATLLFESSSQHRNIYAYQDD